MKQIVASIQVRMGSSRYPGKVMYETPNANNLTDHALPVALYVILVAQNANNDMGIPKDIDIISAFFVSNPLMSCRLVPNQTRQCITVKIQKIKKYCIDSF